MTERLYYDQPYLTAFDAVVTACRPAEKRYDIALDRSAFYPTSGGQPYDTGILKADNLSLIVSDVMVENDTVWHRTNAPLDIGTPVSGAVDWARRWDHMQQHGGEHLLAGCIWHLFRGVTRGLHMSEETSTIDVKMPDEQTRLSIEQARELEMLVNRRIQQDAPIRCWFPDDEELQKLPLRKPSSVQEHVRVVAAGDFEMVPCGGTHPSSTGQIGLLKVLSTAPARGYMRVTFLAGERALQYMLSCHETVSEAGRLLSASCDTLVEAVHRLLGENADLKNNLKALQKEKNRATAERLLGDARPFALGHYIAADIGPSDLHALKEMALSLAQQQSMVVLLSAQDAKGILLAFARSGDLSLDMGKLLRGAGAQGGGRPDFAQGKASDDTVLQKAQAYLDTVPKKEA